MRCQGHGEGLGVLGLRSRRIGSSGIGDLCRFEVNRVSVGCE